MEEIRIYWATLAFYSIYFISGVVGVGFGRSYSPREACEIIFNPEVI